MSNDNKDTSELKKYILINEDLECCNCKKVTKLWYKPEIEYYPFLKCTENERKKAVLCHQCNWEIFVKLHRQKNN